MEQLEQLFLDREVLIFRDHLKHYQEFLDEYKRLSYLATVDDDYLMKNYQKYFKETKATKPAFENETNQ